MNPNSLTQAESTAHALQFLRSIIDNSLDIIQVFSSVRDASGKIIDFTWLIQNQRGFEQNGDVYGRTLLQKNPGVVTAGIFDKLIEVTNTGTSLELEQYYATEQFSGDWFYMALVKQDDGVIMTTRNITAQKKSERELQTLKDELAQKTTDRYLKLFNAIDEGFCTIEVFFDSNNQPFNWRFIEVNSAFEKNNGLSDAAGKDILDLSPDIEPKWFEIYGSVAKTGKPLRFKEHSVALNRHFDLYAFRVDQPQENHVAVIFTDITQRVQNEEALRNLTEELSTLVLERTQELQRSNDDLRQFAHVASHDLKEPVRKIRTFNNRILEEFEDVLPPQIKLYVGKIESACARMYSMIDGVLHYSKLGAGGVATENINLNHIIEQINTDLEIMFEIKEAHLIYSRLPKIEADKTLIYQLFYNLILNSLKFSIAGQPSRITIVASEVSEDNLDYYKVTVNDNGIGFEPEYSQVIFNAFTRLNAADHYEGSGIGLALCKKIVERYEGRISADALPGQGASITILFPIK